MVFTQLSFTSFMRTILALIGGLLVGHMFFGLPIDPLWGTISGIVLEVVVLIWSLATKTVTEEIWQGLLRHVVTFGLGILTAKMVITDEVATAIITALGSLFPWLQAGMQKSTAARLANGSLQVSQLTYDRPLRRAA